jgi:hypothetical protein
MTTIKVGDKDIDSEMPTMAGRSRAHEQKEDKEEKVWPHTVNE